MNAPRATIAMNAPLAPLVCIIDFHHARGPEVERWIGLDDEEDPAVEHDWPLLPFMALSDGAHASTEDYSYFTLRRSATSDHSATSLFGISCTRQLDASLLLERPAEVTRSTVQKAVVVISDSPQYFGAVKAQLGVVTAAWFAQRDFADIDILQRFQESLPQLLRNQEGQPEHYFGISLRELIHEFKWQTLVLFKCALLQPKVLFFGSHCERLCMMQFALISLIPGLIRHLQDSADPKFNSFEENYVMPTSLKTSERSSLLAYMGLPLQLFGKGSLFGPYTPLQQLDMLADQDTKSYIVGSTNSLLLQQKDRYSDILINLDDHTVNTTSTSLRQASILSTPDRRWIDFLTQTVNDTWDETDPARPKDHGYAGSEEFIRMQFEEYLLAMLSAVKYKQYLEKHPGSAPPLSDVQGDPSVEFSHDWVHAWQSTENFRIWDAHTDSHLFDIVEPKHPCTGGLSIEDVQRRLAQQVAEMHLDERLEKSRDALNKQLAVGQAKFSSAYNKLWADMEALRKAQRERAEETRLAQEEAAKKAAENDPQPATSPPPTAPSRTSAYLSSWGVWASEKRRGWAASRSASSTHVPVSPAPASAGTLPSDVKRAEDFGSRSEDESGRPRSASGVGIGVGAGTEKDIDVGVGAEADTGAKTQKDKDKDNDENGNEGETSGVLWDVETHEGGNPWRD